jgi:hypothetical protein
VIIMLRWNRVLPITVTALVFVLAVQYHPAPAATMLVNGSFEATGSGWISPWYLQVKSGGAGTVNQTSAAKTDGTYSALVNVTQASGPAPWLVQISQSRLALADGQAYTITFSAKAASARSLDVVLQKTASPYTVLLEQRFSVAANWQSFSFTYCVDCDRCNAFANSTRRDAAVWVAITVCHGDAPVGPCERKGHRVAAIRAVLGQ